ncbi:hypothetical protein SUGI_0190840 [Cryptomeria japonica]|uniref:AAA-ATPase At5g57480 n=1 Tax=Cryptomeria japonica TaxID=3369 RepID=UPI002408EFD1|nr:AAA-ATPase At5g57480 [Cryptomeria japonica]GLJ12434.1 hypothetical protein SUGI_0190840 [Cryptomeria japonica]
MESDKTMLWSMMGLMSLQSKTLPDLLIQLYKLWKKYRRNSNAYSNIEIPEFQESSLKSANEIYTSVRMYLSSLDATANARRVSITRSKRKMKPVLTLPPEHTVKDEFKGAQMQWKHVVETEEKQEIRGGSDRRTERKYILKISNEDRARVLSSYIKRISKTADDLKRRSRDRKLFSNDGRESSGRWSSVAFKNPSTFKTLALKPSLKHKIKQDLNSFLQSRAFYHRTGRAWKRGYLLYGPPGTGKSSLIAAIANYMNYDVYDLELTAVWDNSSLRQLLLATSSKSIIVIEDIDCAADLPNRAVCRGPSETHKGKSKDTERGSSTITLSGLLNFADGLWSSCGEERVMIFTTNHKDRLDPALLRSGRMDMHIHLSYCEFEAFKQLVYNYLDVGDHLLFSSVEEKMKAGGCLTPAAICEILLQNKSDPDSAIKAVIDALDAGISSGSEKVIESCEDEDEEESSLSQSSSSSEE